MATLSWPAVGDNGLTDDQWGRMYDSPDGVTEDYTGNSLSLTRISAGDIARIGTGIGRVNGYYCEITSSEDLVLPAVSTPTTYYIWIKYDPTLNIEDGSGNADPLGPCRLGFSAGAPSTTNGEKYLLLYAVTRSAGQNLNDAGVVVVDHRRWTGPHVGWPWSQPVPPIGVSELPRGTTRWDSTYDRMLVRTMVGSSLGWKELGFGGWIAFPYVSSALVANVEPAMYSLNANGWVRFRGTIKRASNAALVNGSDVNLGTMPAAIRPPVKTRVPCQVKKPSGWGQAGVGCGTDGVVTLYDPGFAGTYVDLSAFSYSLRA